MNEMIYEWGEQNDLLSQEHKDYFLCLISCL